DRCHATEGFCHLAQRDEKICLVAFFQNFVQITRGKVRIFAEEFTYRVVVWSIFHRWVSFASPARTSLHDQCQYPVYACHRRTTGEQSIPQLLRSRGDSPRRCRYAIPTPLRGRIGGRRSCLV